MCSRDVHLRSRHAHPWCCLSTHTHTHSRCVSRVHIAASNSTFTFTKVDVRWRGVPEADKAQLSKANCAPFDMACLEKYAKRTQSGAKSAFQPMEQELSKSLTSGNGGVVSEYFSSQYGLRWALFIATTARTMEVYHALPVPSNCAKEDDQSLLVSRGTCMCASRPGCWLAGG